MIDSLMPRRSGATVVGVEAVAGVADEPRQLGVVGLDEDVDPLDAGVAGGVDDGLADRRDERPRGVVERLVADDHRLHPHVVVGLDGDGHGVDRRVQRHRVARVGRAVQPRAQLALLAPGQRRHPPRVVGALDQHQRLQHRVVQVGGHPRPLVLADARRPLVVEAAQQATERRGGEDRQAADDDGDRAGRRADVTEPAGAVGQRGDAGDEQRDAGDDLDRPVPPSRRRSGGCRCASTRRRRCRRRSPPPAPSPRRPATARWRGRRGGWPRSRTRWPARDASVRRPTARGGGSGSEAVDGHRGEDVQHGAEAAGQRQQADCGAHDGRLDAPAIGPPAGDAGDHAIGAARACAGHRSDGPSLHRRAAAARRHPGWTPTRPPTVPVGVGVRPGMSPMASTGRDPYRRRRGPRPAFARSGPGTGAACRPSAVAHHRPIASSAASPPSWRPASGSTPCGCASRSCCWRSSVASASCCTSACGWSSCAAPITRWPGSPAVSSSSAACRSCLQQDGNRLFNGGWAVFVLLVGLAVALWRPRQPRPAAPSAAAGRTWRSDHRRAGTGAGTGRAGAGRAPGAVGARAGDARHRRPRRSPAARSSIRRTVAGSIPSSGSARRPPSAASACSSAPSWAGRDGSPSRPCCSPAPAWSPVNRPGSACTRPRSPATSTSTSARGTTTDARRHVVLGSVDVQIVGAPSRPITVDARVAIGDVDIHVPDDVTVEVRARGGDVTRRRRRPCRRHVHGRPRGPARRRRRRPRRVRRHRRRPLDPRRTGARSPATTDRQLHQRARCVISPTAWR